MIIVLLSLWVSNKVFRFDSTTEHRHIEAKYVTYKYVNWHWPIYISPSFSCFSFLLKIRFSPLYPHSNHILYLSCQVMSPLSVQLMHLHSFHFPSHLVISCSSAFSCARLHFFVCYSSICSCRMHLHFSLMKLLFDLLISRICTNHSHFALFRVIHLHTQVCVLLFRAIRIQDLH